MSIVAGDDRRPWEASLSSRLARGVIDIDHSLESIKNDNTHQ